MRLSRVQLRVVEMHLQQQLSSSGCQVCGERRLVTSEDLWEIRTYPESASSSRRLVTPLIMVTCSNCGQVLLFDAHHVGAVD